MQKQFFIIILLAILTGGCGNNQNSDLAKLKQSNIIIDSLFKVSNAEYKQSNKNSNPFDEYLKQAYEIAKSANNQQKMAKLYNLLGKRYRANSNFQDAIWYHQQAINISEIYKYDTILADATYKQAVVFRHMDDNAQSYKLCIKALELAQHIQDTFLIHCVYNGIGNIYFNHKKYAKAIDYYSKSLEFVNTKKHNYLGEAINTNTLGESWLFLGNTDSALFYLNKSLSINLKIKSKLGQAICYNGRSLVYLKEKKYSKAIKESKKALGIQSKAITTIYQSMFRNTLGKVYLEVDSLNLAKKYLTESFEISSKKSVKREAMEATRLLVDLYRKTNDLQNMSKYINYWASYKDSITNHLITQNSESMSTLYQAEKQQREIFALKQKSEVAKLRINRQRNIFIFLFVILLFTIVLVIIIYRHRDLQNKLNEVDLEQRLFRSQLNPHFIFNALSSMQNFIVTEQTEVANDYLVRFSSLMRNVLIGSRSELLKLGVELETINNYIKIQQLRFYNKFTSDIKVDESIDKETCLIPPMLIQPFIENSIEHGIKTAKNHCLLDICFKKEGDKLHITIEDNGVGIQKDAPAHNTQRKHVSLATTIITERLDLLEKKTKTKCSLSVINKVDNPEYTESGVKVIITIPYLEDETDLV